MGSGDSRLCVVVGVSHIMWVETINVGYSNSLVMAETMYGDFWANSVEILAFASPTGYMLTSSGFFFLNLGYTL